jgi:Tol biopolymer transport system component
LDAVGREEDAMKHAATVMVGLALVVFLPQLTLASDPEILLMGSGGIGIMDRDGSNLEWIVEEGQEPDWSPDGNHVVFYVFDDRTFHRIDLTTRETHLVVPAYGVIEGTEIQYASLRYPVWSVRGEIAARTYIKDDQGITRNAIVVTDEWGANGVHLVYVSNQAYPSLVDLTWSPDGTQIATFEDDDAAGSQRLIIIDRSSGDVVDEYYLGGVHQIHPEWSRDGIQIAFVQGGGRQDGEVTVLNMDTAAAVPIIHGFSPSWSPDDSQLVFSTFNGKIKQYTFSNGAVETLAAGSNPVWRRGVDLSCTSDADCDDGNPCTDDYCVAQQCENDFNFLPCDDANECTEFDTCSNGYCIGDAKADGEDCSLDMCCSGECVFLACYDDTDCADGETCEGGGTCAATCVGLCGQPGDPCVTGSDCCSGLCHPRKGTCK